MKTKKVLAGAFACTVLFGGMTYTDTITQPISITANAVESGTYESLTYTKYDNYIAITDCDLSATEVIIPSEIDSLPVTNIGEYAFEDCESLLSVTIPDSITTIETRAFIRCTGLTSITIPNSVTSIGKRAFYSCDSLTSVTIPSSVKSIETSAFSACNSLTSIIVDADNTNYTSVDGVLFDKNATELLQYPVGRVATEYTIEKNIKSIGDYAFFSCSNLTSITLPDNITSIGDSAFKYCYDLTSITISNPECEIVDSYETICNGSSEPFFAGTVYGYENSTAQTYADTYGYTFVSMGEAPTATTTQTETTTSETTTTTTATTTLPSNPVESVFGDVNGDYTINASDASAVLAEYASLSSGGTATLDLASADVNEDGVINASDASAILAYYAYISSGGTGSLADFL